MELSTRRVLRTMFATLLAMFIYVAPAMAVELQSDPQVVGERSTSAPKFEGGGNLHVFYWPICSIRCKLD